MADRLTDKQKKKIIADYIQNQNYSETARMNNTSKQTVSRIIEENKNSELERKLTEKKEENTQSTLEYMKTQHETKKRILDKILKAIEGKVDNVDMFTNIKDLATAYGIILDKELKYLEVKYKKEEDKEGLEKVQNILVSIKEVAGNYDKED